MKPLELYDDDRVRVERGDCDYWGHDSHWAPNGATGRVDGSWRGHPGGDDEHLISVVFSDRGQFVASMIFKPDELVVVRRSGKKTLNGLMTDEYRRSLEQARTPAPGEGSEGT